MTYAPLIFRPNRIGIRAQLKKCSRLARPAQPLDLDAMFQLTYEIKQERERQRILALRPAVVAPYYQRMRKRLRFVGPPYPRLTGRPPCYIGSNQPDYQRAFVDTFFFDQSITRAWSPFQFYQAQRIKNGMKP